MAGCISQPLAWRLLRKEPLRRPTLRQVSASRAREASRTGKTNRTTFKEGVQLDQSGIAEVLSVCLPHHHRRSIRMTHPGGSKGKSPATQKTLLGFFSKAPPSQATPIRAQPSSSATTTPAASVQRFPASSSVELDDDGSLTPPPSVRKPSAKTSTNFSRTSDSPTDIPAVQTAGHKNARIEHSTTELTPPSSSPLGDMDVDEDDEDSQGLSRFPRRRAAVKRSIRYIESDDEEELPSRDASSGKSPINDEDDDSDCFQPEVDKSRTAKKRKHRRGRAMSSDDDDDDDEFDDFIEPDDDLLGALDEADSVQKKAPKKAAAPSRPAAKASTSTPLWSSSAKGLASTSKSASSGSKKTSSSEELPYDFLLDQQDENGNRPTDGEYDPRTLYIPARAYKDFTPFEKQYWDIKRKHYDTVLFFQKGKFFELYENDALIAHQEFGLKLTDRVKMKMAGVPESSYTMFANKFLALGYKVGRVDQTETAVGKDMRKAAALGGTKSKANSSASVAASDDSNSKIVRRDLRSIMTTGTIVDADCLPDDMSSYCVSIKEVVEDELMSGRSAAGLTGGDDEESMQAKVTFGICILEAGVAQFRLHHFVDDVTRTRLETLLRSLRIKEVLYEKGHLSKRSLRIIRNSVDAACNITMLKSGIEFLDEEDTLRKLNLVLNKDLVDCDPYDLQAVDPVDVELLPPAIAESLDKREAMSALGAMLTYLTQLNLEKDLCASRNFDIFDPLSRNECMILDAQSLTHLNVLLNEQGDTQGTLLQLVNRAVTPFGKRLMKVWLLSPLARIEAIQHRQDAVEEFIRDNTLPDDFYSFAKSLPDIERIMPRIYAGNCKSKDFAKVLRALTRLDGHVGHWKELASGYESDVVSLLLKTIPSVSPQAKEIHGKYEDETFEPRKGCDQDYDDAFTAIRSIERELQEELVRCAKRVKLPADRVKFKDVGTNEIYQIEVPIKTVVPADWTLTSQTQSVKRYYSSEIRILVKRLKEARETRVTALKAFQSTLFIEFQEQGKVFLQAVKGLAELDCLVSLSKASHAMNEPTCRAEFVESETAVVDFIELRHPCLTSSTDFIANDIQLGAVNETASTVTILTGGNMAGKSTTARTTAVGVILAQLGCRVPAIGARLSPIDRIATRMGANDQLFRNNSTFMVEMLEASRILKEGTPRSLVIMDELGRGTSTFDGQAIAHAVLHHLIGQTRSLCFFLTHYTQLAYDFEGLLGVKNKHMQVVVDGSSREVVFTYKLVDGIAESSYGTEVAALAGIPHTICEKAKAVSKHFLLATKETEAMRRHKVQSKLETSTISDFVHLFKAGTGESLDADISGKTIAFMRKQMQHLFDGEGGHTSSECLTEVKSSVRTYTRRPKRAQIATEGNHAARPEEDESSGNPEPAASDESNARRASNSNARAEQMVLDLGQKIQITCKACDMTFDRSDRDDHAAHEKHHARIVKGVEWQGKRLLEQGRQVGGGVCREVEGIAITFLVYEWGNVVDTTTRSKLAEIHKDVDAALGASAIPPNLLEKTKTLIAVSNGRVVASLIAGPVPRGRVRRLHPREDGNEGKKRDGDEDEAMFAAREYLSDDRTPPLGVHRIYVSPSVRRKGLGSLLLDHALSDCVYGISPQTLIRQYEGKPNTVAFSQPTRSGRALAQSWIRRGVPFESSQEEKAGQTLLVFDEADL